MRRARDELDASTAQVPELQGPEADGLGTHDSEQTTPWYISLNDKAATPTNSNCLGSGTTSPHLRQAGKRAITVNSLWRVEGGPILQHLQPGGHWTWGLTKVTQSSRQWP